MPTSTLRVLLLDDNPHDRDLTRRELRKEYSDLRPIEPLDEQEFRRALASAEFEIVITDYNLKWSNGLDIVRAVKAAHPQCPVIMFTATGTQEIAVDAMKAGLDDYVIKSAKHYIRLAIAVRSCLDRAEIRLRALRSETRLQTLLDRLNVGVLRLGVDGQMMDANRACKALLQRFGGDTADSAAQSPLLCAVREVLPRLKARNDAAEREVELFARDGQSVCVYLSLLRVRVNGHDAIDVLVEDVTSMRRSAERNEKLEQVNRALESFAFTVSHDLRAPLRNLQGYVLALSEDAGSALDAEAQRHLDAIEEIAVGMDAMIGDILEFSRLSRVEVPAERVLLRAALDESLAHLHSTILEMRAQLEVRVDSDVAVLGHYQTLVQVLTNLVANGLKFVAEGVQPALQLWTENRPGDRLRLWVEDNGIGIDPSNHQRIFEVFQRLHGEEKYPGTGIGLALVRKGVERMGGQIGVESSLGQGSRFWIELKNP